MAPLPKSVHVNGTTCRKPDQRGFTLLDLLFVIALIGVLCVMAIPGIMRARGAAQAASAIGTMRAINSGELTFAITCGLGFYAPDLPTLGVRPPAASDAFLPDVLTSAATVVKHGYTFSVVATPLAGSPASCNGLAAGQASPGYVVIADTIDTALNGRFFATNADGILYEHTASLNGVMPEVGVPPLGSPIR